MTTKHIVARWLGVAAVPVLIAAIVTLQMQIDRTGQAAGSEPEELLLRSPAAVKKMSLGYDSLIADIYWTRAVQYYGRRATVPQAKFDLLWPLLDITTTLDPKLLVAYHFGAIFLSEPDVGADRPDLAVALIKRGIAANPERWGLYSDLGFLYYWYLRDYAQAAKAYLDGSSVPQGPAWMKIMAARMEQKGGSIETSRMIWSEIYASTQDRRIRDLAQGTLHGLKAEEDENHLDELAGEYRKRVGRYPSSTSEMRDAGLLTAIPVDPLGYPYVIGPDGKSRLNPQSPIVIPKEAKTPPALAPK